MSDIAITGLGIVSALGIGVETTVTRLLMEKTAIGPVRYLDTVHKDIPVGEVPYSDDEMRTLLNLPTEKLITRTSLMGRIALIEALKDAQLSENKGYKIAFISGNTVGGMEKSELYYHHFLQDFEKKEFIAMHDCGACSETMSQDLPLSFDLVTTPSTACSSAANSICLGADLIKTGRADIVVAGGTECLSKFHLNGFNTLMILDREVCKPFDKNRQGLNLGEGAAFVVMERPDSALKRGAKMLCKLAGYANRCDAFHQTASSPNGEGAFQAMKAALADAGLQPSAIDYVNAHGTGTPNNDESEGQAMMRLFGDKMPSVSSTKAFTGHTTSASGAIEAVISILALTRGFIPANLNFKEKIDSLNFEPVSKTITNIELKNVLNNAFGFGGNDTSCLFSKI
ncbi:MAG: beta-ketoacyl-[acyl-carrier-protein] synthase family protein [Bacteroidales bacterium]|nr:beta-ketoacyl-[acyl-carrier-protein] synthase family protein [Bacteroidales bacterium]